MSDGALLPVRKCNTVRKRFENHANCSEQTSLKKLLQEINIVLLFFFEKYLPVTPIRSMGVVFQSHEARDRPLICWWQVGGRCAICWNVPSSRALVFSFR